MRVDESADELVDDREYAVPRELLFEMWTQPEHFARWFGPHGAEMPYCEIDARPGGVIRFMNRFVTTGEGVAIEGVFDEVIAPSRLRFTFTFVDAPPMVPDWPRGARIEMTIELFPTKRGTRMTVRQRVDSPTAPAVVRHRRMAGEGWRQTVERLLAYLEQRSS